jgi:hypothetical protein
MRLGLVALNALSGLQPGEQFLHRDAQSLRNPHNRCKPKILSPGSQVPDESSVQLAIVCEFFLRFETSFNTLESGRDTSASWASHQRDPHSHAVTKFNI